MRAAVVTRYGEPDVIEITERPTPKPRKGEVLIRVTAAAVTAGDSRMRSGRFPAGFGILARAAVGFRGPRARILGNCVSGTVERVGPDVTELAPGDAVTGMTGARMGAHAEFALAPANRLTTTPAAVSPAAAAGVLFGGTTAMHFLHHRARLRRGEAVLVNGASGAVGSAAVQLAHLAGARVTAVTSARNHERVRRLGAERVIDYRETPATRIEERFDVVLDAVGTISAATGVSLLTPRGRLDAIRDAHRLIDSGRKVGNLVILPGS